MKASNSGEVVTNSVRKPLSLALQTCLSHLLLPVSLGGLSEGCVVRFHDDQVASRRMNHQFPRGVLQGRGHLVEDHTQFLQRQDPVTKEEHYLEYTTHRQSYSLLVPERVCCYGNNALRALL